MSAERRDLRQEVRLGHRLHDVVARAWRMPQTLSVSCPLLVHRITGMSLVLSSLLSMRVAWKPFCPGITTSMSTRSGRSCLTFASASSALSAVDTLNPFLDSMSLRCWRSVGESSTTRILLIVMLHLSENQGEVGVRLR